MIKLSELKLIRERKSGTILTITLFKLHYEQRPEVNPVDDGRQVIDGDDRNVTSIECPLKHLFKGPLAFNPPENCLFLLRFPKVEVAVV